MKTIYRIYPGIGIARIGNSTQYIIGPESPSMPFTGPFKENGKVKKQAARFRIYELQIDDLENETVVREITDGSNIRIAWQVHLVNKKAASRRVPTPTRYLRNPGYDQDKLVIESNDSIEGVNQRRSDMIGTIEFVKNDNLAGKDKVVLGHLETDDKGRLLIIGGNGVSRSPLGNSLSDFVNNLGWYDDCCDGPVSAVVTINGGHYEVEPAWVVVGSPAFAPNIHHVVTWYDHAENVSVEYYNSEQLNRTPSFKQDIYPLLKKTSLLSWVSPKARIAHRRGSGGEGDYMAPAMIKKLADNSQESMDFRKSYFERLMPPNTNVPSGGTIPTGSKNMPYLSSGVDPNDLSKYLFASLTGYQYTLMKKWANGDFISDWTNFTLEMEFERIEVKDQPSALDKAALTGCIGGPFFPGVEATHLMANVDTYETPFRINRNHPAGYLTELLALPWQADYLVCGELWWPAQRPVSVKTPNGRFESFVRRSNGEKMTSLGMVNHWQDLGFIIEDSNGEFVETERGHIP